MWQIRDWSESTAGSSVPWTYALLSGGAMWWKYPSTGHPMHMAQRCHPTFKGFRNLSPVPFLLSWQLSFGHVTVAAGCKWMWSRPALDWWAKLSAAGTPCVGAFESFPPSEGWLPKDVEPLWDIRWPNVPCPQGAEPPSGAGDDDTFFWSSSCAVRHTIPHSVEQRTVSQEFLTQPVRLYRTHFCLWDRTFGQMQGKDQSTYSTMLPSLWLEMCAFEKWDLLSRDQGDDAHHEMQVHHYLHPSSAADRCYPGVDAVSHTWGRYFTALGLSRTQLNGLRVGDRVTKTLSLQSRRRGLGRLYRQVAGAGKMTCLSP